MRGFVLNLLLFLLLLIAGLELVFRTVIPASNIAYKTLDKQYSILLHDTTGERQGLSTTGRLLMQRVQWRINNCGWRCDKDYFPPSPQRKPVIALIGDSYVAGFQVNYPDHFGARLEARLDHQYDVYNFGSGGVPASQYVYVAKYAHERFDPDVYVFLVRDPTWKNSIANYDRDAKVRQLRWKDDHFEEVLPKFTSSRLSRLRKRSALIRYLVYNANVDITDGVLAAKHRVSLPSAEAKPKTYLDAYPLVKPAMEKLLGQLRADLPGKTIIFLTNVNIENIYDGLPGQSQSTLPWLRELGGQKGIYVLDLAPAFAADYQAHREPLTFDIDYHWNERGHQVVADTLFKFLMQEHLLNSPRPDSTAAASLANAQNRNRVIP
ncbi:MAG TPA: SGNH/GDSL hydrolase family protein [bacterium]|jgi:hypothetical protein